MKAKLPYESILVLLDRKFPIIERMQDTPSGWAGVDRLFSPDALDHAEYVDLTGNSVDEDDHRQWAVIRLAERMVDNIKYWNEAFSELWYRYGFSILSIISGGHLTPRQQKVMELMLDGNSMVEIQTLMGLKHRSDVTRHFQRAVKRIQKLLPAALPADQMDKAA